MTEALTMINEMDLLTWVAAAGALGTAAFGVTDGLKAWSLIGEAGFGRILAMVKLFRPALERAYGPGFIDTLRDLYRNAQNREELARTLRQGVRLGLGPQTADALAKALPVVDAQVLVEAATALQSGNALTSDQQGVIGRFEVALDARIEAALARAACAYVDAMRIVAAVVAVVLSELTAGCIYLSANYRGPGIFMLALAVGALAVPIAPIVKDVSSGISAAAGALRRK